MLEQIKEYAPVFTALAAIVAVFTYVLNIRNSKRVLKNEFLKKQIEAVIHLVSSLNAEVFEIYFTRFTGEGSSAGVYRGNLFEIERLRTADNDAEFFDHPLCFAKHCNQIFDFKPFLNNAAIPSSISQQLEKFYSRINNDLTTDEISGKRIIVLYTKHFEKNMFDVSGKEKLVIWEPSAFALLNFQNFLACIQLLEDSIVGWLKSNNIHDVNINKHQTHR
jgi:hypothetical protein